MMEESVLQDFQTRIRLDRRDRKEIDRRDMKERLRVRDWVGSHLHQKDLPQHTGEGRIGESWAG